MKKFVMFICIFVFSLLLTACDGTTDDPTGSISEIDAKLNSVEEKVKTSIPSYVMEDITLMEYDSEYNATIEWSSSNGEYLDDFGTVNVDRKSVQMVDMSYLITIDGSTREGIITVAVTAYDVAYVSNVFERQFSKFITRDYDVTTSYFNAFTVEWDSSNTEVFTNEGQYIQPRYDVDIEIRYTIEFLGVKSEEFSFEVAVLGVSDAQIFEEASEWIKNSALTDLYLTDKVTLPTKFEKYDLPIIWRSSNTDVVSSDGKITHYVFERYVTLTAVTQIGDYSGSANFECIVAKKDTSQMSETEILDDFLKAIALTNYAGVAFSGNGAGCNQSYGALNFYVNEDTNVIQNLIPIGTSNRTEIKQEVKLIICHDTGNMNNTATALANSNYVKSGYGGSSTGWHYTVGNDGVYQTVPDDEVAYNANGSSNTYTTFIKTDIKATAIKPNVSVNSDGYITINNVATQVRVTDLNAKFASDGPLWEIGNDGYYYVAKPWYCSSHGYNANQGGNANGIGIESAVNNTSDYLLTCRKFSKLVAELLIKHDLNLDRVVQHNTMSGKDCPNAMRSTNFWYTFKDMIAIEKFAKENLSQYTFTWTGTGDIDNTGKILKGTTAKTVSYSVVVSKGSTTVLNRSYTTNINLG